MTENGDEIPKPRRRSKLADVADASTPSRQPKPAMGPVSTDEVLPPHRAFARLLGEFRRTAVLVPFDEFGSLWTADFNGVRWICAFSDEAALARFAVARGDAGREWTYRTVLGARLLDVMVPMLPGPGGVALDAGSPNGTVFPPVAGVVPDEVAVDLGGAGTR
ncbi:SseB family protein [Streptomyces sp. NPDC046275]|uniref:SseB family protein n=1 Tax=Streptomyces sp. NPDC046275 TaxID=3157201 RepID=UPI0033F7F16D